MDKYGIEDALAKFNEEVERIRGELQRLGDEFIEAANELETRCSPMALLSVVHRNGGKLNPFDSLSLCRAVGFQWDDVMRLHRLARVLYNDGAVPLLNRLDALLPDNRDMLPKNAELFRGEQDWRGIYFLVSQGRVIYVGKAENVKTRLYNHKKTIKGVPFDSVYVVKVLYEYLVPIERKFIQFYKCPLNSQGRKGAECPGWEVSHWRKDRRLKNESNSTTTDTRQLPI